MAQLNPRDTVTVLNELNDVLSKHFNIISKNNDLATKYFSGLVVPSNYKKGIDSLIAQNEQLQKSQDKLLASKKKAIDVVEKQEKASLKNVKLKEKERLSELKLQKSREKAFDKYEKQLQVESRRLQRTTGLYNQVQIRIAKLTAEYNNLATKKALNGKLNKTELSSLSFLERQLTKYQSVLKKVDGNIGKYQRNVGNYKSAYDGLGFSIAQLTREAPAFANSLQTGFMAISNNLPIFFDEISRTKREVASLRAEGKQTTGVLGRLAKSFFSFQTLLSVGVTLLTIYGKDLVEWASSAFNASDAGFKLSKNIKEINKQSAEIASQSIPKFKGLISVVQDHTKSENERKKALEELNQEYPEFNSKILEEKDNTNLVNEEIDKYISKIHQKAKAQAAMTLAQEKYNELILIEQEIEQEKSKITEEDIKLSTEQSNISKRQNARQRSARRRVDEYNSLLKQQSEKQSEINDLIDVYTDNVVFAEKAQKKLNKTKYTPTGDDKPLVKGTIAFFEAQISKLKTLQNEQDTTRVKYQEHQREIDKITKKIEELKNGYKELDSDLESLGFTDDFKKLFEIDPNTDEINEFFDAQERGVEIMNKLKEATQSYLNGFTDDFISNSPLSGLMPFVDGSFASMLDKAKDLDKAFEKQKENGEDVSRALSNEFAVSFNAITEAGQQAFSFIDSFGQENFEAQQERLIKDRDDAIQYTGEIESARAEIERQYEAERAEIQRKQAQAQKKKAIFDSIINTAQAVVSVLAQEPGGIIKKGIAAAIVGGMGAAQTALIASQQIPQFKDGVQGFDGGYAILGDGGKHEYVTDKNNNLLGVSKNKDTLYDLPKGANVYKDENAFMQSLNGLLDYNAINPIPTIAPNTHTSTLTKSDVLEVMNNHAKILNKSIKNMPTSSVVMDSKGVNLFHTIGNERIKVLNARSSGKGKFV